MPAWPSAWALAGSCCAENRVPVRGKRLIIRPPSTPIPTSEPPTPTPTRIPGNPVEIGFYDPTDNIYEVTVSGDLAYLTGNGLHVLDISDPANPVELSFLDTPGRAWDVAISGNFAYLASGAEGIFVIDISDPSNPIVTGSHNTPEFAQGIAVAGDLAYVADRFDGLGEMAFILWTSPTPRIR